MSDSDAIPYVGVRSLSRLGWAVRAARIDAGMSQADLAEAAHVSRELISRIESGRRGVRFETLVALLSSLDYELAFLPRPNADVPDGVGPHA